MSGLSDRPDWITEVRLSAHACTVCGSMVALDLLDQHVAWHERLGTPLPNTDSQAHTNLEDLLEG